jgi:hypothetical protein
MDERNTGESKIRRREEMLARRVGEALDQMSPGGTGECPDAEIIAAYAEQALEPAESLQWEGHFATCARCRKILRVLAASADAPLAEKEVARLGELVSAGRAPAGVPGKSVVSARPLPVDWRMRWMAPALGVAAVLTVWFAMRPPWRATNRGASETLVAQAPKEEVQLSTAPTEQDRLSRVAPPQDQKADTTPSFDRPAKKAPSLDSSAGTVANDRADSRTAKDRLTSSADEATNSLQEKEKSSALAERREIQPPATPPSSALPPKTQAATEAPAVPQSEAKAAPNSQVETNANAIRNTPSRDKQAATVQGETSKATAGTVAQAISPKLQSSARNERTFTVVRPTQKYDSLLKGPSGSHLWRAGKGGIIERTTDAGKTWVSQMSPSQEDWLAGSAVSDTVCWLVGRNGAIARTTNGERWDRVSPPSQALGADAKLPDWTSITAADDQSATITASDGRRYATPDAGKTWQLQ